MAKTIYLVEHFAAHFRDAGWGDVAVHHREVD
jgi:hypothetical protein